MSEILNPTPKVKQLAEAIAKAEGFYVAGSLPARIHNPGDLEIGNVGYGTDIGKTIFPDDQTGWEWLYGECMLMLAGQEARHHSHVYNLSMTFLRVAQLYTGGDNYIGWAEVVSAGCGMKVSNTLQEFLDANLPETDVIST